jgi:hydroxymethylpyrimidine kinase / phosphomethylpyrimidine kinase / thiamine-phosphate diphosphorylase
MSFSSMEKKVVLSIAGSDPSGGAGIQADLKSFSFLGLHGTTVITCVTAQNTQKVSHIQKIPVDIIEQQLDRIFEDFTVSAVKTGMLYDAEIVACVARKLASYKMKPVVDPVMVATSGDALSKQDFIQALKKHLLLKTQVLTANIPEACELAQTHITSLDDVRKTCITLSQLGPSNVLIKGGHLESTEAVDIFYDGTTTYEYSLPMIKHKKAHGSGCTLSALITGFLALGELPVDAIQKAKWVTWQMILDGYTPGKGSDVLNHLIPWTKDSPPLNQEQITVWLDLKKSIENLLTFLPRSMIPEVGMNFVYALPHASKHSDVCAINGRIIKQQEKPVCCGGLMFGASKHVASIVLAALSCNPELRSAANIRYSLDNIDRCKQADFKVAFFDRNDEPKTAMSTMEWGTLTAIKQLGCTPDMIYDTGGIGKEPMIRILGINPAEVVRKIQKIY